MLVYYLVIHILIERLLFTSPSSRVGSVRGELLSWDRRESSTRRVLDDSTGPRCLDAHTPSLEQRFTSSSPADTLHPTPPPSRPRTSIQPTPPASAQIGSAKHERTGDLVAVAVAVAIWSSPGCEMERCGEGWRAWFERRESGARTRAVWMAGGVVRMWASESFCVVCRRDCMRCQVLMWLVWTRISRMHACRRTST